MSAGADTAAADTAPAGATGEAEVNERADLAGRVMSWLTVGPVLAVMAWLLVGLPLLLLGWFRPVLMIVLSVPLAIALAAAAVRWAPGRWQAAWPSGAPWRARTPWWAVVALVVVAVAFGAEQLVYHSQQIIVQRDPASYFQFGNWLARRGSLPVTENAAAFGHLGNVQHLLSFNSPAFYQRGASVWPQFMAGLPMALAAAFWAGGVHAAVLVAPVLGALGVLTFGGLVARLAGPRWAWLGALALALALPQEFTSRSSYSETVAQILFLGGLCLVIDSFGADGAGQRVLAAMGGAALGLTLLARIDGASDLLPVIPYAGLVLLGRRRQALPLIGGVIAGAAYGAVDGLLLSRPYLASIKDSLLPLVAAGAAALVITAVLVALRWRRGVPEVRRAWLPNAAAAAVFVILAGFVIRPYVQTARGNGTREAERLMAMMQRHQGLKVDPTRLYWEISLHWVYWYVGIPVVVLGTVGAALLARRCLRGKATAWVLPLVAFAWIIVSTLLRPAIFPDQPWASRRLVPGVLPGFILLAVWASAWLVGYLRQRGLTGRPVLSRLTWGGAAVVLALAMVLPTARTTFGLAHQSGGPVGVRLVAAGTWDKRTYIGEIHAIDRLCAAIPANASVLIVYGRTQSELSQVVRGMCGVPTSGLPTRLQGGLKRVRAVRAILASIRQAGRIPVILSGRPKPLKLYGGPHQQLIHLRSHGDAHTLVSPPLRTGPYGVNVWMSEPPG